MLKTFPPECTEVMNVVIQIVNKIITKGSNHRQSRSLLDEVESRYSALLLHDRVRWLSREESAETLCCMPGRGEDFHEQQRAHLS